VASRKVRSVRGEDVRDAVFVAQDGDVSGAREREQAKEQAEFFHVGGDAAG